MTYCVFEIQDNEESICVGTTENFEEAEELAYDMSRRYDCEYMIFDKYYDEKHDKYEYDFVYRIYNGKIEY